MSIPEIIQPHKNKLIIGLGLFILLLGLSTILGYFDFNFEPFLPVFYYLGVLALLYGLFFGTRTK
jgi:hypothetical protein